jgi:hypothetical protein
VRVEGRVTNLDQLPSTLRHITLRNPKLALPLTAEVGADGRFELPMALPGAYEVELTPVMDKFARALTISGADVVRVEMPAFPPLMKVGGKISGLWPARGRFEMVLGKARIDFLNSEGPPVTRVLPDGSFTFSNVQVGSYDLTLSECSGDITFFPGAYNCETFKAGRVTVNDKDVTVTLVADDLVSTNTSARVIAGRVTVDGKPAAVRFTLRTPWWHSVRSDADGAFQLSLGDGSYDLAVLDLPLGVVLQSITHGNADLSKQPLRVSRSRATEEIRVQFTLDRKDFATVSGRVTGVDRNRGALAVILKGGEYSESFQAPVNADGTFRISGLPYGRYGLKLNGAVDRSVSDALVIAEVIGDGMHKAGDVSNLEIVVPPNADEPANLRSPQ